MSASTGAGHGDRRPQAGPPARVPDAAPSRPRGPNVLAIVVALASFAAVALVLLDQLADIDMLATFAPVAAIAGVGTVLVVAGLIAYARRR